MKETKSCHGQPFISGDGAAEEREIEGEGRKEQLSQPAS